MTAPMRPGISACPACSAAPAAQALAHQDTVLEARIALSLPCRLGATQDRSHHTGPWTR